MSNEPHSPPAPGNEPVADQRWVEAGTDAPAAVALRAVEVRWSKLLSDTAHKLRTPLGSVQIMADLLASDRNAPLDERQRKHLANIHRASREILTLVDDVVELSKIASGRRQPELGTLRLVELARRLEAEYGELAHEQGRRFAMQLDDDLPAAVTTDGGRLEQLLRILLDGALEVAGGTALRLALTRRDGGLRVAVGDDGDPVDSEAAASLFEPYPPPGAVPGRRYGASGLGLPLAWQLARLLGGRLELAAGDTTTFLLELPPGAGAAASS